MFIKRDESSFLTFKIFEICFSQTNLRKLVNKFYRSVIVIKSTIGQWNGPDCIVNELSIQPVATFVRLPAYRRVWGTENRARVRAQP